MSENVRGVLLSENPAQTSDFWRSDAVDDPTTHVAHSLSEDARLERREALTSALLEDSGVFEQWEVDLILPSVLAVLGLA